MGADSNLVRTEDLIGNFLLLDTGLCREYILQRCIPGCQCLFQADGNRTVFKSCPVCYLTDHRVGHGKISNLSVRYLAYDIAPSGSKEISRIHVVLNLHAKMISKRHLADRFCQAVSFHRISRDHIPGLNILKQFAVSVHGLFVIRQIILVLLQSENHQLISGLLKLRRDYRLLAGHIHSKGNQGWRNI